jgi:hypothetical protein
MADDIFIGTFPSDFVGRPCDSIRIVLTTLASEARMSQ